MTTPTTLITTDTPQLEGMKRADLPTIWNGFHSQLSSLVDTAKTLTVTSAEQLELINTARTTRLALRRLRLDVEAKRKELTDFHLRTKQEIDSSAKWLKDKITPLEDRLEEQEKFAERQAQERRQALIAERSSLLLPFGVDVSLYHLADMDAKAFSNLYDVSKYSFEEAQARAKEQAEDQARLKEENARLHKEAELASKEREALEATALKEKREADAKLHYERQQAEAARERQANEEKRKQDAIEALHRAEQQKREAVERELQAAKDKEAAALAAQKAADEKAAQAPDREKLVAFALAFQKLPFPVADTEAGRTIFEAVETERFRFGQWIASNAAKL